MKILQIMPAQGWNALCAHRDDNGEIHLVAYPLVCWALVEDFEEEEEGRIEVVQRVMGMIAAPGHGVERAADHLDDFCDTYVRDDEDLEDYRPMAEEMVRERERAWAAYEAEQAKAQKAREQN